MYILVIWSEVIFMKGRHNNTIYYEVKITQTKDEIILLKLTRALLASGSAGLQGAISLQPSSI